MHWCCNTIGVTVIYEGQPLPLAKLNGQSCENQTSVIRLWYRWTWIWRTQWDQENWSVICKIRRIHMTNTWYASDWDQAYRPSYSKICRTVVRHIQVHLYQISKAGQCLLEPLHNGLSSNIFFQNDTVIQLMILKQSPKTEWANPSMLKICQKNVVWALKIICDHCRHFRNVWISDKHFFFTFIYYSSSAFI